MAKKKVSIQLAYNTLANWTAWNGVLLSGQMSIISDAIGDAVRTKIGDGNTVWIALPYYNPASSSQTLNQTLGFGNTTSGKNQIFTDDDVLFIGSDQTRGIVKSSMSVTPGLLTYNDNSSEYFSLLDGGGIDFNGSVKSMLTLSYLDATSSIQTQLNAKEPTIAVGATSKYWRGDKTFQTLDTSVVTESTNLYYTQARFDTAFTAKSTTNLSEGSNLYWTGARGLSNPLSGLSIVGGSISASDSTITAFGKLQNQINGVLGGAIYQGVWNATTNSPTLTSSTGTKGYYYVVSVAGSTNLDGTTDWKIGDWAIFNGATWDKVDNTDAVSSVFGRIGAVVATSGDYTTTLVTEGTRLYFTTARVDTQVSTYTGDVTLLGTAFAIGAGKVTNAMLAGSIAYSKLSLTGAIVNADLVNSSLTINGNSVSLGGSTTITANVTNALTVDNSSLQLDSGTTFNGNAARTISVKALGITNAMLAGSIAYGKLTLTGSILNADIVSLTWSKITSTPTTLSGYGITDPIALTTNPLSQFASTTSAQLLGVISDETGSGSLVFANSPTLTTAVLGSSTATTQTPFDNSTKLATTAYVDAAVGNLDAKTAVQYCSTSALPANTYANGSSGVGATLTGTGNGPLIIDGVTILVAQAGERVLVAGESTQANNGWYTITQVGVIAVSPYILTRSTDSDQAAEIGAGYLTSVTAPNSFTPGSSNNGKVFISVAADPFTVGTTALTFSAVGGVYSAGNGLTLSGQSFTIDTSVTVDKTTSQTLTNKTLTSPTLTTPTLGVASATTINKLTITAPATGSTLTIADGKTLTCSNTLTFTGTDTSSVAFGAGGTVSYNNTFSYSINLSAATPLASTTYYWSDLLYSGSGLRTTAGQSLISMPYNATLIGASITVWSANSGVSNQAATVNFRYNGSDTVLSNAIVWSASATTPVTVNTTGLNLATTAGTTFEIKMVTGAWTTAPTTACVRVNLYFTLGN